MLHLFYAGYPTSLPENLSWMQPHQSWEVKSSVIELLTLSAAVHTDQINGHDAHGCMSGGDVIWGSARHVSGSRTVAGPEEPGGAGRIALP